MAENALPRGGEPLHHPGQLVEAGFPADQGVETRICEQPEGEELKAALRDLNYTNLDEHPAFRGKNTTTEFLAREIFERLKRAIAAGKLGEGAKGLATVGVRLHESHVAWGGFEGPV